jgi:hypothetical protein
MASCWKWSCVLAWQLALWYVPLWRGRVEAMPADAWKEERERHWKKWGK